MSTTTSPQALGEYLRTRLKHLEQCKGEMGARLDKQFSELERRLNDGNLPIGRPEFSRHYHRLEYVVANTFRCTMLVGLCSYLEEAVKEITKQLVTDYDAQLKTEKHGSWLAKHMRVIGAHGTDLSLIKKELNTFHDLLTLRNCIVHAWGRVEGARDPQAVEAAVGRIETAEIFKDGFLYLGDQVLPEAICAAEKIADSILASEFNVSIT